MTIIARKLGELYVSPLLTRAVSVSPAGFNLHTLVNAVDARLQFTHGTPATFAEAVAFLKAA